MKKRVWVGILVAVGLLALVVQMAVTLKPFGDVYRSGVLDVTSPRSTAGTGPVIQQGSCFVGQDGEVRMSTDAEGTYWCSYPPESIGDGQRISAGLSLATAGSCGVLQFRRVDGSGYAAVVCQSKITLLDLTRQKAVDFRPVDGLAVGVVHEVALTQTAGRVTVALDGEQQLSGSTGVTATGDGAVDLGVTRAADGPAHVAFTDVTIDPYG